MLVFKHNTGCFLFFFITEKLLLARGKKICSREFFRISYFLFLYVSHTYRRKGGMSQDERFSLPACEPMFLKAEFHALSTRSDPSSVTYVRPQLVTSHDFEYPWPGARASDARLLGEYSEDGELRLREGTCNKTPLISERRRRMIIVSPVMDDGYEYIEL